MEDALLNECGISPENYDLYTQFCSEASLDQFYASLTAQENAAPNFTEHTVPIVGSSTETNAAAETTQKKSKNKPAKPRAKPGKPQAQVKTATVKAPKKKQPTASKKKPEAPSQQNSLAQLTEADVSSLRMTNPYLFENRAVVFFDLETSGLEYDCDILQIACKCGAAQFNEHVKPTKPIHPEASKVTGMINVDGELYVRGSKVDTSPIEKVLQRLLTFLRQFKKMCILVAHNGFGFDAPRLVRVITECGMGASFKRVVSKFADSLQLFYEKFPDRKYMAGRCNLTTLAREILCLPIEHAHDAMYDVQMLEQLVFHSFTFDTLMKNGKSFLVVSRLEDGKEVKKKKT